jgi:hypothetical protein
MSQTRVVVVVMVMVMVVIQGEGRLLLSPSRDLWSPSRK